MTFSPKVVACDPGERFAWRGRLVVPFAFDGYHEFHLEPIEGEEGETDRTRVLHRETLRGLLVILLLDEGSVGAGFEAMNLALAERAEARAGATV